MSKTSPRKLAPQHAPSKLIGCVLLLHIECVLLQHITTQTCSTVCAVQTHPQASCRATGRWSRHSHASPPWARTQRRRARHAETSAENPSSSAQTPQKWPAFADQSSHPPAARAPGPAPSQAPAACCARWSPRTRCQGTKSLCAQS